MLSAVLVLDWLLDDQILFTFVPLAEVNKSH